MGRFCRIAFFLLFAVACAKTPATPGSYKTFQEFRSDFETQMTSDPSCQTSECQQMRTEFRWVAYVGEKIYCYWDEKKPQTGMDYQQLAKNLESSITDETTLSQYYLTLRAWAASFQDGHVNVMASSRRDELEIFSAGVRMELLNAGTGAEELVVTQVKPGTPLSVGDRVLEINGQNDRTSVEKAARGVSGSTERMRRYFAAMVMSDQVGLQGATEPLHLRVERQGRVIESELRREISLPSGVPVAEGDPTGADLLRASILPGAIGYLRIDGFSGSNMAELLGKALDRMQNTKGLVLDLRRNGGGDQSGDTILARLTDQAIVRYRQRARMSDMILMERPELFFLPWAAGETFSGWVDRRIFPAPPSERYHGPVMALVSPYCFSACDTFSSALKVNHLATLLGMPTGGGTGSPLVFDLPVSNFKFRYSVMPGRTAVDGPIEGVGTMPDVVVETHIEDVRGGNDPVLNQAIAMIQGKSVGEPPGTTTMSPIWLRSNGLSPTVEREMELKRLSLKDEI